MASILKVDQIQKPSGAPFTLADMGVDESGRVLQTVKIDIPHTYYISCPNYSNNRDTKVQIGNLTLSVTTKSDNSKIRLDIHGTLHNVTGSHTYFDVKRNGVWLESGRAIDALIVNHSSANVSQQIDLVYIDSPNVPAGTTVNYTFFVGDWGGGVVSLNNYGADTNNRNSDGFTHWVATELKA